MKQEEFETWKIVSMKRKPNCGIEEMYKMKVPGGYIYRYSRTETEGLSNMIISDTMVFVPYAEELGGLEGL